MKTMNVFEARNNFSRTLDAAREDVVVVTRNGKPVAAIQGIDDDDLEDLLLERSGRFWEMIARARKGKPISLARVRKEVSAHETRARSSSPQSGGRRRTRARRR